MTYTEKIQNTGLIKGKDFKKRCWWCGDDPLYMHYHDTEWGREVTDDFRLYEKICLEGFQAGLSWITILRKRENFRAAFHDFDFHKVAKMDKSDVESLLQNEGIIRHRGKIEATINNAKRAIEIQKEYGTLYNYFIQYKDLDHIQPRTKEDVQSTSQHSIRLSKDLKKRGWKFIGPTTCYAFMQAMGLINDHIKGCDYIPPPTPAAL